MSDLILVQDQFTEYLAAAADLAANFFIYEKMAIIPYRQFEIEDLRERFMSWSYEKRALKLSTFLSYKSHYEDFWSAGLSTINKVESFKRFMNSQSLKINDENKVMSLVEQDTFIEIYNPQLVQIYRSLDFYNYTNHSLMALEVFEWVELFQRSFEVSAKVHAVAQQVFLGITSDPIYNPVEEHVVQELHTNKPASHRVRSLAYAATLGKQGEFMGGLHICKIMESKSLRFKVMESVSVSENN